MRSWRRGHRKRDLNSLGKAGPWRTMFGIICTARMTAPRTSAAIPFGELRFLSGGLRRLSLMSYRKSSAVVAEAAEEEKKAR